LLSQRVDGTRCPPVVFLDHHLCHAASAMLVSVERGGQVVDGASRSPTRPCLLAPTGNRSVYSRVAFPIGAVLCSDHGLSGIQTGS
jgi:carbamoyltransferase